MRVYVPVAAPDLARQFASEPGSAYMVTSALRSLLPDEDQEGLEYAVMLAAADACMERIGAEQIEPPRRLVAVAEVPDEAVRQQADTDAHPALVALEQPVSWEQVVAIHIDEPAAEADIRAAVAGDESAAERVFERALLWYDVTERIVLADDVAAAANDHT